MPTKKKRVAVTCPQELYDVLEEFSIVSGVSKSGIVVQMMTEMVPAMRQLTQAYQLAKTAPHAAFDELDTLLQKSALSAVQTRLNLEEEKSKYKPQKRKSKKKGSRK